jgi:hypothetical protein
MMVAAFTGHTTGRKRNYTIANALLKKCGISIMLPLIVSEPRVGSKYSTI